LHIRPANWLLAKDRSVRPYEFCYPSSSDEGIARFNAADPKHEAFIQSLAELLNQKGAARA